MKKVFSAYKSAIVVLLEPESRFMFVWHTIYDIKCIQFYLRKVVNIEISKILVNLVKSFPLKLVRWFTGSPSLLHERRRDSCLRAVLCYKRLFTKACMGCKRFFLKERKNVMFLNKIDLPYCLVVFFVVYPRLWPFWSVFGELALFWCSTAKRNSNKVSRFYLKT